MDRYARECIGKLYNIDAKKYANISIDQFDISNRILNSLRRENIHTVEEFLNVSPNKLLEFSNMGMGSFYELSAFVENTLMEMECESQNNINKDDVLLIKDSIRKGELEKLVESEIYSKDKDFLQRLIYASSNVESELIVGAIDGEEVIIDIIDALKNFYNQIEGNRILDRLISELPIHRQGASVNRLYEIYIAETKWRAQLVIDTNMSLKEYIYKNKKEIVTNETFLTAFIKWCHFDLYQSLGRFIDGKCNERGLEVLNLRAQGYTLEEVGNKLGVTRERIRQIEKKENGKILQWIKHNYVIQKIQVDLDADIFMSEQQVVDYFEKYGEIINSACKTSDSEYNYDRGYSGYILDERKVNLIEEYVDTLSETIHESELESIMQYTEEEFNDRKGFVKNVIEEQYKKTGETYHKSRLTLSKMYSDVLVKYYPNGIHVSDKGAIEKFKALVFREFGVGVDSTDRAIASIIARIGILCDRGQYKHNSRDFISNQLANEIYDYIKNSETPAFLTNTIFEEFEEKLVEENITNKYFMQGVLHDKFEGKLFFRRDYVSKDNSFVNLYTQINNYIEEQDIPVDKQAIFEKFPGVTEIVVNLATCDENIINLFGKYIYGNKLRLTSSEKRYLKKMTDDVLEEKGTTHCKDIYNAILKDNPVLLTNNYIDQAFCLFSVLEYLFREELKFDRPYIAKKGVEFEKSIDTLLEMIRDSDEIKISHILAVARESHYTIQSSLEFVNSCNDTHLLIDRDTIASIEMIGVSEEIAREVERMIDDENINDTMSIASLKCIYSLPKINENWNDWLLYSVMNKWSKKYEVAASNNQLRLAIPLIAPIGKMDINTFDGDEGMKFIHADNLENIDELIGDIIIQDIEGIDFDEL